MRLYSLFPVIFYSQLVEFCIISGMNSFCVVL